MSIFKQLRNGKGLVQIDEKRAKPLWHALRGGWHYQRHSNGTISNLPRKDIHSHPGDAFGYGAAVYFPAGEHKRRDIRGSIPIRRPKYWRRHYQQSQPFDPLSLSRSAVPDETPPEHGASMPSTTGGSK